MTISFEEKTGFCLKHILIFLLTVSMQDPPVKTVRKFLHLLEHSDADFEEELGT